MHSLSAWRLVFKAFLDSAEQADSLIEKQFGQDVIDSLSVLEAVVPAFHRDLRVKLSETFPMLDLALRSRFAIVRQAAARCFATLCDVMTSEAMHHVIEHLVPLLSDPLVLAHRQGATELIYRQYTCHPMLWSLIWLLSQI